MKRKFSKILGVGLALALLTSMLVTGVPVAAQTDITDLVVTVTPNITDAGGYYQVIFRVHNGLQASTDTISIRFPVGTTVPEALETALGTKMKISSATDRDDLVNGGGPDSGPTDPTSVTVTDHTVMMWLPAWSIPAEDWVMVEFGGRTELGHCGANAGIMNPDTAGTYTLWAWTCESPTEVSDEYDILEPPGPVDIYEKWLDPEVDCGLPYFIYRDSEDTIQDAIDAADTLHGGAPGAYDATYEEFVGYRLVVHDGTYEETIRIDVPGLIVESMNGAAFTTIDANGVTPEGPTGYAAGTIHCAAVMIIAEGVTFGGTGVGFTVKDAGVGIVPGTDWADDNSDDIADVSGVYIWPNDGGAEAPQEGTNWCRVNVIGNTIYGSQARGIIADASPFGWSVGSVCVYVGENTVYDNLFEGFQGSQLSTGPLWADPGYLHTSAGWGYTAIVNNEFYQNGGSGMGTWEYEGSFTADPGGWKDAGIEICSTVEVGGKVGPCYIVDNDIHDNEHSGINLLADAADDGLVIKRNAIYDNDIFGISNSADNMAGVNPDVIEVDCRHNDIYGNGYWGVKNFKVEYYFDAKENFWGELGGPSCGPAPIRHETDQCSLALGNGDAVSHWVYYNPWLSVSYVTVLDDGIRYYGSDTLTLQAGWNTLSVPLALYTSADTLADIDGLGNFLDDMVTAYAYDATAGNWVVAPAVFDLELETGRGFYIKMSAVSNFPVLYSNQLGLPAFELAAGWNLIGATFGIDKVGSEVDEQGRFAVADTPNVDDAEAKMQTGLALDSIGAQASVVVSPSVPGQIGTWSEIWVTGASGNLMYTGEAYWAFLTSIGTLAGWEITPFYFTPPAIP